MGRIYPITSQKIVLYVIYFSLCVHITYSALCKPAEEGSDYKFNQYFRNEGDKQVVFEWSFDSGDQKHVLVSRCWTRLHNGNPYCQNHFPTEFMGEMVTLEFDNYILTLTIQKVTRPRDETEWTFRNTANGVVSSCNLEIYSYNSDLECSKIELIDLDTSRNSNPHYVISWSCSISQVYPKSICVFYYKDWYEIGYTRTISHNHVHQDNKAIPKSIGEDVTYYYYDSRCELKMPVTILVPGIYYTFKVVVYPNLSQDRRIREKRMESAAVKLNHPQVTSFEVNDEPVELFIDQKMNVIFRCTMKGNPKPSLTIKSLRNNKVLDAHSLINDHNDGPWTFFTTMKMDCNDTSVFVCSAVNGIMAPSSKNVSIFVKCPPQLYSLELKGKQYKAKNNTDITIRIPIFGYPEPVTFTLAKVRNEVGRVKRQVFKENLDHNRYNVTYAANDPPYGLLVLRMMTVLEVESGQYVLTIDNGIGSGLDYEFDLKVGQTSDSDTSSNVETPYVIGLVLTVVIIAILAVIIVYLVRRVWKNEKTNKKPTQTFNIARNVSSHIDETELTESEAPPLPPRASVLKVREVSIGSRKEVVSYSNVSSGQQSTTRAEEYRNGEDSEVPTPSDHHPPSTAVEAKTIDGQENGLGLSKECVTEELHVDCEDVRCSNTAESETLENQKEGDGFYIEFHAPCSVLSKKSEGVDNQKGHLEMSDVYLTPGPPKEFHAPCSVLSKKSEGVDNQKGHLEMSDVYLTPGPPTEFHAPCSVLSKKSEGVDNQKGHLEMSAVYHTPGPPILVDDNMNHQRVLRVPNLYHGPDFTPTESVNNDKVNRKDNTKRDGKETNSNATDDSQTHLPKSVVQALTAGLDLTDQRALLQHKDNTASVYDLITIENNNEQKPPTTHSKSSTFPKTKKTTNIFKNSKQKDQKNQHNTPSETEKNSNSTKFMKFVKETLRFGNKKDDKNNATSGSGNCTSNKSANKDDALPPNNTVPTEDGSDSSSNIYSEAVTTDTRVGNKNDKGSVTSNSESNQGQTNEDLDDQSAQGALRLGDVQNSPSIDSGIGQYEQVDPIAFVMKEEVLTRRDPLHNAYEDFEPAEYLEMTMD